MSPDARFLEKQKFTAPLDSRLHDLPYGSQFSAEKIAMTPETKCVETIVVVIATVIIVIAKKDMFFETRHVGRLIETMAVQQMQSA